MKEMFPGVFKDGNKLYTQSLVAVSVYNEKLVGDKREWIAERSKLAAAIIKGLRDLPIAKGSKVLYLGASTGTTVSHVSDIIKLEGIVYAIEFAERVFRGLMDLVKQRKNIAPILADVRKPEEYAWVEECDVVYCDVADPQESEIAIRNAQEFLKDGGFLFIAIKSQSIDVTKNPQQVYKEEAEKLKKAGFAVLQIIDLEPHERKHAMIVAKR